MSTTYTPTTMAGLIRALMSRSWAERRAADSLLFKMLPAEFGENRVFDQLWAAAIAELEEHEAFISSLCRFWLDATALAYSARMSGFGDRVPTAKWARCASEQDQPDDAWDFGSFDLYGLGVRMVLRREANRYASLAPLWIKGLQHPEPIVLDTCWALLGSCEAAAPAALLQMLELAFRRGPYFSSDAPMKSLARVVEGHPGGWRTLESAVREPAEDSRIEVLHQVLRHLPVMPESLFNWMVEHALSGADPFQRYFLFVAAARDAAFRDGVAASRLLAISRQWSASTNPEERRAAGRGLGYLGNAEHDADRMIRLLKDEIWRIRSEAAQSLADWTPVSDHLILAVANLLGDYDGYDGYPENSALQTLIAWGPAAAPALPVVAKWLGEYEYVGRAIELIEALGHAAYALHSEVEVFTSRFFDDPGDPSSPDLVDIAEQESEAFDAFHDLSAAGNVEDHTFDSDDDCEDEVSGNHRAEAELLARLGISPLEHIPGTYPDADSDQERLRRWIARARSAATQ